jgi:isoquinoline 1-oxidoreductase beta subunit
MERRNFLKIAASGGLLLGLTIIDRYGFASVLKPSLKELKIIDFNSFIHIGTDNRITLINTRPEIGQGTYQSVPMLIAEELEVALDRVSIKQSDGSQKYGNQLSGGSSSVLTSWDLMRKVGASAREMLIQAAADRWKVPVDTCYARNGVVYHSINKEWELSYGSLAEAASELPVPENPKLKEPAAFKLIGKKTGRPDIPMKVNGSAVFGMDVKVEGMVYAAIEHSPVIFGKIVTINDAQARAVPGVFDVVVTDRILPYRSTECVAVIASSFYAALQGRRALSVSWDESGYNEIDTDRYFEELKKRSTDDGLVAASKGSFIKTFQESSNKLTAYYETPFLAHAPMEPECAIASVGESSCEVWAPVQDPVWAARDVAAYLKIPIENVKVNVPFVGGAFGRKAYHDYILEAVCLARKIKKVVKVIWRREDDISQGPFRPGVGQSFAASFNDQGGITSFQHKVICESIVYQTLFGGGLPEGKADAWAAGEGLYSFDNASYEFVHVKTEIPIVWWRAVYHSNIIFGYEVFIDELAHAMKSDPIRLRKKLLATNEKALKVLNKLEFHLMTFNSMGREDVFGIAMAPFGASYCAHAVILSKVGSGAKIERVISVIDCGLPVNPDNIRAQTEGNIIMGITAAIRDGITLHHGKVDQTNFHNYRVLRIHEVPPIDVHIMDSSDKPSGVGETALPPIAPALANAVFNLTGVRIRKLPFNLNSITA